LLTKYLRIEFFISIFASFLFTFSSPNVIALSSHPQLFTIYLTPILLIGFAKILRNRNTLLNIISTFLLLGLIFSTAIYIFIFIVLCIIPHPILIQKWVEQDEIRGVQKTSSQHLNNSIGLALDAQPLYHF
jgi:hypothetical protein